MANEVLVELKGIIKDYETVRALKGIDLTIRKGEVHCLAGGNGCGKSTLIKIISGVIEPTEGEIYFDGDRMEHMKPLDAIDRGIQVIYQNFEVFPNLTVAENIAINTNIRNKKKFLNRREMRELAIKAMDMIGTHMDPDARLEELSMAAKQLIALCRAIINEPRLLILDEPTTALTAREVEKLWEIVAALRDKGIAILLVDHKLDEIREIGDYITVMRNGELISRGSVDEYNHKRFLKDITGRDFEVEKYRPETSDINILTVSNLTREGAYYDVSFKINKGDVLGITGLLGSGRNEIANALFGLCPANSGQIILNGREIRIRNVQDAINNDIGLVPEDRLTEGLFIDKTVRDNMISASLSAYQHGIKLDTSTINTNVREWIEKLGIAAATPELQVSALSGGNAQKVVLSKWLNTDPKLLILMGPSVGMDVGAKADIHNILHELAAKGVGILMVTDDLAELVENCNKILIVRNNRIVAETDNTMSKKTIEELMTRDGGEVS